MKRSVFVLACYVLAQAPACGVDDSMNPQKDGSVATRAEQTSKDEPAQGGKSATKGKPDYVPNELIVTFQEGTSEARIDEINKSIKVQVARKMYFGQTWICQVKVPQGQPVEAISRAYSSFPEVKSVEPNYKVRIQ